MAVPLVIPPNRWTLISPSDKEPDVERKVNEFLNKPTVTKFDSIPDRIIEWANESGSFSRMQQGCAIGGVCTTLWGWGGVNMIGAWAQVQDDGIQDVAAKDAVAAEVTGDAALRKATETPRKVELHSDKHVTHHRADS